jgi:predicted DNA-binding WGR domain protein
MTQNFSFGLKVKFTGKKYGSDHVIYLSNTSENHNKYYHMLSKDDMKDDYPYLVIIDYGKFGALGNRKFHKFLSTDDRTEFVEKLLNQKIKKGYNYYTPDHINKVKNTK